MSKSKFVAALLTVALSWGTFTLAAVPGSQEQQSQWNADSAKDLRAKAYYAKTKADELKARVSQKSEYDELIAQFKAGDESYLAGNYTAAVQSYLKVLEGFASLCAKTAQAKDEATVAVEDAKERVEQSEQEAIKADQIKPLGDEPVEGIEDHDAKMLEDDDFSKEEYAAVEISATIGEDEGTQEQDTADTGSSQTEGDATQEGEGTASNTDEAQAASEQSGTSGEAQAVSGDSGAGETTTEGEAQAEAGTESEDVASQEEGGEDTQPSGSADEGSQESSDSAQQGSASAAGEEHSAASTQQGDVAGADEGSDFVQIEIEFYEDIEESELEEE